MKARLNKTGTDYVGNYGSRAFFNKLMQEAETWRHTKSVSGVKQANTQGDAAANAVSHAIQEYALKPFEQLGNKSTIYAEPIKVKNSIEQLNKRIDDLYGRIKNKDATDFDRGHLNALENVRDHLRGLMKETAPGQYVKLRAGDAAYSDLQTPQSASAKAAGARKGVYGPQDLIDAIREDVNGNDKILAAGAGRYQPFATEGFDVVGDPMKHRDHSLTGLLEHAFGISMAPVGAPAVGAFYNSPARTAAAKWYTGQGPVHRAARTFAEGVRNAPARMGGLSAYAMDPIANSLFTGTPDNGDR
jgi:hypothetical protein